MNLRIKNHQWIIEDNKVHVYVFESSLMSRREISGASLYEMLRHGYHTVHFFNIQPPAQFMVVGTEWIDYLSITEKELNNFFYYCDHSSLEPDWRKCGF